MAVDRNYFIDRETFEVYEEYPKAFICDENIAFAVANLNRLGYKTEASCEGHYKGGYMELTNTPIEHLEYIKQDPYCIVGEIREKDFDYCCERMSSFIYIRFKENYDFKELPEGFSFRNEGERCEIDHPICYYDSENRRRKRNEIEQELKYYQEILNEWAIDLANEKERGK